LFRGAGRVRREQFFVQRSEPALDTTQTQRAFSRDRPVRQPQRQIPQRLSLKLREQRSLKLVLERRVDHVRTILEHGGNKAHKPVLRIIFVNKPVRRLRVGRADYLAYLIDIDLMWKLRPEDNTCLWKVA